MSGEPSMASVRSPNPQLPAGDSEKLDDPDANGVRPVWRPGGEDSVLLSVAQQKGHEHLSIAPFDDALEGVAQSSSWKES